MSFSPLVKASFIGSLMLALSACGGSGGNAPSVSLGHEPAASSSSLSSQGSLSSAAASSSTLNPANEVSSVASSSFSVASSAASLLIASSSAVSFSNSSVMVSADQNPPSSFGSANNNSSKSSSLANSSAKVASSAVSPSSARAASSVSSASKPSSLASSVAAISSSTANISTASISSAIAVDSSSATVVSSSKMPCSMAADSQAPKARIMFPTPMSMTEGDSILVRGTASDDVRVQSVQVNGVEVTTSDNYANWQLRVPLVIGMNKLIVSVRDSANNVNSNAAEVVVKRELMMRYLEGVTLDSAHNQAFVVDSSLAAIIAVDLTTGARRLISDNTTPNASNGLGSARDIALDSAHNRLLLADLNLNGVMAVDLTSGARTVLSSSSIPNADNGFSSPMSIAIDSAHNRALVADSFLGFIVAVDLNTGARTILSGDRDFYSVTSLRWPLAIVVDDVNNTAYVADGYDSRILSVDLATGARRLVSADTSSPGTTFAESPAGIVLDSARKRLLVQGATTEAPLIAVDIETGERTAFSNHTLPNSANPLTAPTGIVLDGANNRVLVADNNGFGSLIAVDLTTGERTLLSGSNTSDATNGFMGPVNITFDSSHNRALVLDNQGLNGLLALDPLTGAHTPLSTTQIENQQNPLAGAVAATVDAVQNRALVVANNPWTGVSSVVAVDLTNGAYSVFSDKNTPNGQAPFASLSAIAMDAVHHRALVLDAGLLAVMAVDLGDGTRSVLSNNSQPDATNSFSAPVDIVVDAAHNRALVMDSGLKALVAVDLITGARTEFASAIYNAQKIFLDGRRNRVLMADTFDSYLTAVDLTSGAQTKLAEMASPDLPNIAGSAVGLTMLDPATNCALVADGYLKAIFTVDLITGEHVYFSK